MTVKTDQRLLDIVCIYIKYGKLNLTSLTLCIYSKIFKHSLISLTQYVYVLRPSSLA